MRDGPPADAPIAAQVIRERVAAFTLILNDVHQYARTCPDPWRLFVRVPLLPVSHCSLVISLQ